MVVVGIPPFGKARTPRSRLENKDSTPWISLNFVRAQNELQLIGHDKKGHRDQHLKFQVDPDSYTQVMIESNWRERAQISYPSLWAISYPSPKPQFESIMLRIDQLRIHRGTQVRLDFLRIHRTRIDGLHTYQQLKDFVSFSQCQFRIHQMMHTSYPSDIAYFVSISQCLLRIHQIVFASYPRMKSYSKPSGQPAWITCHLSKETGQDTWSRSGQRGANTGSRRRAHTTSSLDANAPRYMESTRSTRSEGRIEARRAHRITLRARAIIETKGWSRSNGDEQNSQR